jgi:hypothetical protein
VTGEVQTNYLDGGWGGGGTIPADYHVNGTFSRDFGIFLRIYIGRASFRDPPLIFLNFLCCFVVELFNLKDLMLLMQKTYLFPLQIGMPHANASKICRIYGYSTLPDYW